MEGKSQLEFSETFGIFKETNTKCISCISWKNKVV